MVLCQTLNGIVEDGSEGVFLGFDGLRELVCEVMSDAADEGEREIPVLIRSNVDPDKIDKTLAHHPLNGRIREVVVDELGQTCEEAISQGLTIDAIDDLR